MKMVTTALALALILHSPAQADVSARYENVDDDPVIDFEMTVEIDAAGNMRLQTAGSNTYYLMLDGEMYFVSNQSGETLVVRFEDFMIVAQEALTRMGMSDDFDEDGDIEPFRYANMGEQTVQGRKGTAYGIISEDNPTPVYASLIIGHDPKLAPVGQALAMAQGAQTKGMGSMGMMLNRLSEPMKALLTQGAPLKMLSIELTDVSHDPIPPERFVLPAEPKSIEALREAMQPADPPPTLPPRSTT